MTEMDANANADAREEAEADVAPLCCGCFAFWGKKDHRQGENGKSETRAHPAALQKNSDRVAARTTTAATAAATASSPSQSTSDEIVEFEAKQHQAQDSDEFVDVSLDDESSDKSNDADEVPSRPSTPLSLRKRKLLHSPRRRRSRANDDDLAPIEPSSPGTPGLVPDAETKQAMEPPCDVKKKLSCDTTEMSAPPCKDIIVENSIDHVSNEHSLDMDDADDFVNDDSTVDESNKNIESDEPATPAVEPSSASSEDVSRERELSSSDTDPEKSGASERLEMLEKADEKAKDSATDSPTDDVERETSPEAENMLDHTVEEFRMHDSASENSRDAECSPNDTDSSVKKAEDETSKIIVVEMRESTPASHQDKNGCTFKTEAIKGLQSKESMITKNAKDTNDEEEKEEEKEKEAELKEDESAGNTRWLEIKDSKTGRMYYYNESTKKSVWKKPADFDRQSVLLAMEERRKGEVDWVEAVDEFGRVYYFDQNTMAARWDRPASLSLPEVATQLKQEKDSLAPVDTKTKIPARKEVLSPTYIARSFGSRARSATSNFHSRVGHICGTNDGNIVEQPHK